MSFSLFPALYDRPENIRFSDQEVDEKIELFLRQHWVVNVPWIFTSFLGLIFPAVLFKLNDTFSLLDLTKIPGEIISSSVILWYLFVFLYVIEKFLDWYFDIYIVTNHHLVDVDYENLQSVYKTEARLDDIQSTRSHIPGILGPLFNYGDVIAETAANKQDIDFLSIPKPDFVRERIQDLQDALEPHKGGTPYAG